MIEHQHTDPKQPRRCMTPRRRIDLLGASAHVSITTLLELIRALGRDRAQALSP